MNCEMCGEKTDERCASCRFALCENCAIIIDGRRYCLACSLQIKNAASSLLSSGRNAREEEEGENDIMG